MKANFWHQKWERGDIAFHESEVNPFLIAHFEKLNLSKDSRVFLPLCGKTRDVAWFLACGYRVVGAELSELAINELFKDLGLAPEITKAGDLTRYSANNIDILVGNIFAVSADYLGPVSAIYDRAALVALPAGMRVDYTSHLTNISDGAPQLLITYEYKQQLIAGPPFSVNGDEVKQHYGTRYHLKPVESKNVVGGLKGQVAATETAWLLQNIDE
jgi:thiopurine S-methyltransferase